MSLKIFCLAAARAAALSLLAVSLVSATLAQTKGDEVVLDMQAAFKKGDSNKLAAQLKQLKVINAHHPLTPWAAYWATRSALDTSSAAQVQHFLTQYAGTYVEDRLRADWLQLLGKRSDWSTFESNYPAYRMRDDKEIACYALAAEHVRTGRDVSDEAGQIWLSQKERDDGCTRLVEAMIEIKKMPAHVVTRKARLLMEANQSKWALAVHAMVAKDASEARVLEWINQANKDPDKVAGQLRSKGNGLKAEQLDWLWGFVGKQAALKRDDDALDYFAQISNPANSSDEHLAWWARAALRATPKDERAWGAVLRAIGSMSEAQRSDPAWIYWAAKALAEQGKALSSKDGAALQAQSTALLETIAFDRTSVKGFYEQLAQAELNRAVNLQSQPIMLTAEERKAAKSNAGLQRALYAVSIGLRAEGVREWNYQTNLHQKGGMTERELLAAADLACSAQVWDRCINTSERTKSADMVAWAQRYPTPHKDLVVARSKEIGLPPAFVYGLVRQESRFITDVRSSVGASGLMQLMPATAKWTAKKIGIDGFNKDMVNDPQINVRLGTAYLQMLIDEFDGNWPLAIAAYNAGPGRSRLWRQGTPIPAAIWIENIPFVETRDYVKKVMANTVIYSGLLEGTAPSLKTKLVLIGKRTASDKKDNTDLP